MSDHDATRTGSGLTPASTLHLPPTIGRYRILREIGEGGMGVVYEAEQQSPRRSVAIKVVRGGRTIDAGQLRMFQREVDTLARLDHPDIAAIYESGCTEDGQHFFAMELIQGQTLDRYIDERPKALDTAELRFRLALFRKIADAVQYAHQRGVIHRDLKPSNIIVTERSHDTSDSGASIGGPPGARLPGIKILDFGLARITEGDLAQASMVTEVGMIKGTLAYMSPEQAGGMPDAIDLRSDVYALGVILYEMLSGLRPYDISDRSIVEAVRVIQEDRPRPLRLANPGLARLDADVETIVHKALEKEAGRRYASAAELSGDITRYLTSQPILARPPSTLYELRKLVARHRVPAALLALVLVLLVGFGIGTSILLARALRAERHASQQATTAERALEFMTRMFEVSDPGEALGNVITAREVLDHGAQRINQELADQPEIQATLMTTMGHVYGALGLSESAAPLLDQAVAKRRALLGDGDVKTLDSVCELAQVYIAQGKFQDALVMLQKALVPFEGKPGATPISVMTAHTTLADAHRNLGHYADAEKLYLATLEAQSKVLGPDHADTLTTRNNLSSLYDDQGRVEEAEKLLSENLRLYVAKHGQDHPESYMAKHNLAKIYIEQGRYADAEKLLREAVASAGRVAGPEHPDTMNIDGTLAVLLRAEARYDEAMALCDKIIAILTRTLGALHPMTLQIVTNKAVMLQDLGRYKEALPITEQVVRDYQKVLGPEHPSTLQAANSLAMIYMRLGQLDEAERRLRELYEIQARVLGKDHPNTAIALENYGNVLYQLERYDEVLADLRQVLDIRTRVFGENNPATSRTRSNLAIVLKSQGHYQESQEILERELEIQLAATGPDGPEVASVRASLASALTSQKKYAEAIPQLRETLRIERRTYGDRSPQVAETLHIIAKSSMETRQYTEAETAIAEAISIRKEKLGAADPETLLSQYWQGKIIGTAGRLEEAVSLLSACYDASVRAKTTKYPIAKESATLAADMQEKLGNAAAAAEWRRKETQHP